MQSVYQLQHYEYDRYRDHLLALDETSRYKRFGSTLSDAAIENVFNKMIENKSQHQIFVIEDEDFRVVGAGHVAIEDSQFELALSVLKEYQSQGMGSALMKRCIEWCQNRNIHQGHMVCLSSNIAVKKLARKHGVLLDEGGESLANITLPKANPISVFNEVASSSLAVTDRIHKLQKKFAKIFSFRLLFNQ